MRTEVAEPQFEDMSHLHTGTFTPQFCCSTSPLCTAAVSDIRVGRHSRKQYCSGCHTALRCGDLQPHIWRKGKWNDSLTLCLVLGWLPCRQLRRDAYTHTVVHPHAFSSVLTTASRSKQFHTLEVIVDMFYYLCMWQSGSVRKQGS